jgi:hypothetical protein
MNPVNLQAIFRFAFLARSAGLWAVLGRAAKLVPLLLLLTLPAVVQAEDFTYTTDGGTITVTGYTGPGGAVNIPSTILTETNSPGTTQGFWSSTTIVSFLISLCERRHAHSRSY